MYDFVHLPKILNIGENLHCNFFYFKREYSSAMQKVNYVDCIIVEKG